MPPSYRSPSEDLFRKYYLATLFTPVWNLEFGTVIDFIEIKPINGLGVKFHPALKNQYIKNYLPQNNENLPQVTLAIFWCHINKLL